MEKQLSKKFYAFIVIAIMFSFDVANAQIVYTDIPDDTCSWISSSSCLYNLDLNNDSTNDFTINLNVVSVSCPCGGGQLAGVWQITLCSTPGNEVVLYNGKPAKLNFGDTINSVNVSAISGCPFLAAYTHTHCYQGWCVPDTHVGNWGGFPAADHYLGLMIQVGSNTYYGWARLTVYTSSNGFIIRDYAYNSTPGQFILAGDTGGIPTGITHYNIQANHLLVYPNPATNSVTIKFPSDEAGEIQIVNLFGQIVFSEKTNAEQTQIDVSKFSEGIYIVRWNSIEHFETKTFSIIK